MNAAPAHWASSTLAGCAARNFFTHSGHVPLVLLVLEALLATEGYFSGADPYLLLLAGVVQAVAAAQLTVQRGAVPAWVNLLGPFTYSLVEVLVDGGAFFVQWHHQAYWLFAIGFTVLESIQPKRAALAALVVVAESVLRSAIPLVLYALFEARSHDKDLSFYDFFVDEAHQFLSITLLMLGILLGFAEVNLRRTMAQVHALTERLREYSGWALGSGILNRAIDDAQTLDLKRVERAVVFMDIRGFTAWSEQQTPEAVVTMLNRFYASSEAALGNITPIKIKYTADEVMVVFATAQEAVVAATGMLAGVRALLQSTGLAVGAGLHVGQVVEGVLGGSGAKAYDFIGDTVNTAQRLCDAASAGELLLSLAATQAAKHKPESTREIVVKGKREPLFASSVTVWH